MTTSVPPFDAASSALVQRVQNVMDAAQRTMTYTSSCSVCGTVPRAGATHAVANPGHVVTITNTTITVYRDNGRELNINAT